MSEHSPTSILDQPRETQPEPVRGLSYEKFGEGFSGVVVPVLSDGDTSTYLIPVGEEGGYWMRGIDAVAEDSIPCHLLPAGADKYTQAESRFADRIGGNNGIHQPLVTPASDKKALVFDPTSVKSLLDVMIITGNDTPMLREQRLAALHGEETEVTKTLEGAVRYASLLEAGDPRGEALRKIYDRPVSPSSLSIELAEKGFDSSVYRAIRKGVENGVDAEMIEHTVERSDEMKVIAADAWKRAIEFAREHNTDAKASGVYTELHKVGDVLFAIPAIASTQWYASGEILGYVDVTGGGHTLTEIYQDELSFDELSEATRESTKGLDVIALVKKLGMGIGGRSTLQRRCLTTYSEDGEPVIHLRESDRYSHRPQKMTNDQIFGALLGQDIKADLVLETGKVVSIPEASAQAPVEVKMREPEGYSQPQFEGDIPIASLTFASSGQAGSRLVWAVGYSGRHTDLRYAGQEGEYAAEDEDLRDRTTIKLGNAKFFLRADYVGMREDFGASQQLLWTFEGDPQAFDAFAAKAYSLVSSSEEVLGALMEDKWGVSPDQLHSKIVVKDSKTGHVQEISFNDNSPEHNAG